MARNIFFSFHYQRDIFRVQQVKQHYLTKESYTEAGYFDGSLEEKAKSEGDQVVKNMIDKGLKGSSVLCVLIGKETSSRRWVRYEIMKSIELGMGVFGVNIHKLKDPKTGVDVAGTAPFSILGYGTKDGKMNPMFLENGAWKDMPYLTPISSASAPYLANKDRPVLSNIFKTYDWVEGNGYNNFATWVETAARQAGR